MGLTADQSLKKKGNFKIQENNYSTSKAKQTAKIKQTNKQKTVERDPVT